YAHFPSKRALLEAVMTDKFASVSAALEQVAQQEKTEFSVRLHQLLAAAQSELDEIKPPFFRDIRQRAPDVFAFWQSRRAALIQKHFGKLFVEGQRTGKVRRDLPARLMIEILLGAVQAIMNPAKVEELELTPKRGFVAITKVILEGVLARKEKKS